ncbi:MAG: aldo/keto reductase [Saprospiraceae bacterium]|uniref:Aldo/keto reductase n=1 Tax=Candidatus Opimibacter skivensis TaxID=2982028 RepID=A0A9D7SUE3_9BACT|nr:aldo/keto reductase [Candidatus Opimibacter skivensis]
MNKNFPALGFGTSRLVHHTTKSAALQNLHVAYEMGIRYFDTAPIYGYGWSEKILGTFSIDKRDSLFIATKIGLLPSKVLSSLPFELVSALRRKVKDATEKNPNSLPVVRNPVNAIHFDSKWAMKHFDQSLRRLKSDYVDALLLHETTVEFANEDETIKFIDHILNTGKARFVGLGSEASKLHDVKDLAPVYTLLQHEYSLEDVQNQIGTGRIINIHGLFQNLKFLTSLSMDKEIRDEIEEIAALDIKKEAEALEICLAGARYLNPYGNTLFSATKDHHIKETISMWNTSKLKDPQIDGILNIIRKHAMTI